MERFPRYSMMNPTNTSTNRASDDVIAKDGTREDVTNECVTHDNPSLLREAVRRAVDFRGDVTLLLDDGSSLCGYLFDARLANSTGTAESGEELRVLKVDSNVRERVPLARIRSLAFTGKDAASGKSWENWLRRYASKKLAGEAASIESEVL